MKSRLSKVVDWGANLVATAFVVVASWGVANMFRSVEVPKQLKLMDCGSGDLAFTETLPPGHAFNILLGVPASGHLPPGLHVHLKVSESSRAVADYETSVDESDVTNWIRTAPAVTGYLIGSGRLNDITKGTHTDQFVIHFSAPPPPGSSLWLCWLWNHKD